MDKTFRLRKNEEIDKIVHKKKFVSNGIFTIYFYENKYDHSRVCISTSKKLGIAVIRNKIRRQIREMVRNGFDFTKKKDYVIVVRKNFLEHTYQENEKSLLELYLKTTPNKE